MKFTKIRSITLTLVFGFLFSFGQVTAQKTVSGTVTDIDKNSLPGVNVTVKGTTQGAITSPDGKFRIENVNDDAILVFSFIGYATEEVPVAGKTTVNIDLVEDIEALSEIVVIGYGTVKKEDKTGSVAAIDYKDFNVGAITSPQELIIGKIPGVNITTNSGAPGEGATIRIRGGSSLNASNEPLIVIDGVPIADETPAGMRNALNAINPNDIATFTVLKDASATAIYGSRASNGVIIITTKKSKAGAKLSVDFTSKLNIYTSKKRIDVLDTAQYRALIREYFPEREDMLGDANTNWQDEIYEDMAIGTENNLSVAGSVKNLPYRVSAGYKDTDGILKTDNNKQTNANIVLNPTFFDDYLKVDVNATYTKVENTFANRDAIGAAIQYDPTRPVYSDSVYTDIPVLNTTDWGGYSAWLQESGIPITQGSANPVALLEQKKDVSTVDNIKANATLNYKFHFLPEMNATLKLAYDKKDAEGSVYIPQYAAYNYDVTHGGGTNNSYEYSNINKLMDFYVNYDKEISAIESNLSVMGGYSYQNFETEDFSINSNVAGTPTEIDTVENPYPVNLQSFFGRFNYSLKNKYLATFTFRADATSRFAPDNRWGYFPAAALAWKINEESFLKGIDAISLLKLRLGWGITGQQNLNKDYYPYLATYTYSQNGAYYMFGGVPIQTVRPGGYDTSIKWEETSTYNAAIDYDFLNGRFTGSLEYYYRQSKDLLVWATYPALANLTNYGNQNIGDLTIQGIEFSIDAIAVSNKDLMWRVGFNAAYNKNEISKLTINDDPDYDGVLTGDISGGVGSQIQIHSVGYPYYSFYVYEQVYDENGDPIPGVFVDQDGDGDIDADDLIRKEDPTPDWTFGINTQLDYKNWFFRFSGRISLGNYVYDNVSSENAVLERLYRPEGPYLGNITTGVYDTYFETPYYLSDYYLHNASYFKMDNISLGYKFEDIANTGLNLTLSATVNNAFTITKYEGLDPEIHGGIDNRIYPRPTVYSFGVNLNF